MLFEDLAAVLAEEIDESGEESSIPTSISMAAGEAVVKAGEQGKFMYVVQSGELEIHQKNELLETVGPNGIVGEMALVDGSLRSATVIARTEAALVPISKRRFQLLVRRYPDFASYVMRVMSLRLRLMNERFDVALSDVSSHRDVAEQLRQTANLDPLTGISNRRHFQITAEQEIERAKRLGRSLSATMLDIDRAGFSNQVQHVRLWKKASAGVL